MLFLVLRYTSAWGENAHTSVKRFLKTKQNKIKKELKLNVNNNVNLSKDKTKKFLRELGVIKIKRV